ncbi:hypothetical protein BYT27DRAFT_7254383 [Phlegmacium glaucopus]|nr:hypothetical protein BYT27DRAFT_7254383 [Phlegmacium glaucopus]
MSSPPAFDFPSSDIDVEMNDGTAAEQSMPDAPPLYFSQQHHRTPLRGIAARRALGMQTPKRTPLFMPESSSPMAFPSSSPVKTPQRRTTLPLDEPPNSDPLDFPS